MTFEEFKDAIADRITDYLPDDYQVEEISFKTVNRSDGPYNGMIVKQLGSGIAPSLNLDILYDDYQEYDDFEMVLTTIADLVTAELPESVKTMIEDIYDYESIKNNLFVMLRCYKGREDYFDKLVHDFVGDMVVTYHVMIGGDSIVAITKELFEGYHVTKKQLHQDAVTSGSWKLPAVAQNLGNMFGNNDMTRVTILSNKTGMFGASTILYPDVLDNVSAGKPVYILPSSIHEVLIHHDMNEDVNHLHEIVREANKSVVSEEDKLSDHVYKYENGKLTIAV